MARARSSSSWRRLGSSWLVRGVIGLVSAGFFFVWWWNYSAAGWPRADRVATEAGVYQLGAPLPGLRTEAGGTACNGRLYVVGGIGGLGRTLTTALEFDPESGRWLRLQDLPEPINHPGVVCADGRLYVVGGFGPLGIRLRGFMFARWHPRAGVYVLDGEDRTWSAGPELPEARGSGGIAFSDGAIWYVGGIAPSLEVSAELFRLDLESDRWERMPPMPTSRDHLRMEAVGGRLYAIAGRKDDLRFNLHSLEIYDISARTWSRGADIPTARGGLTSAVLHGQVYTFGGEFPWTCSSAVERYDPALDAWETLPTLPEGRHGIVAGNIDGRIHLVSGGTHPRLSASSLHRIFEPR